MRFLLFELRNNPPGALIGEVGIFGTVSTEYRVYMGYIYMYKYMRYVSYKLFSYMVSSNPTDTPLIVKWLKMCSYLTRQPFRTSLTV